MKKSNFQLLNYIKIQILRNYTKVIIITVNIYNPNKMNNKHKKYRI